MDTAREQGLAETNQDNDKKESKIKWNTQEIKYSQNKMESEKQ